MSLRIFYAQFRNDHNIVQIQIRVPSWQSEGFQRKILI